MASVRSTPAERPAGRRVRLHRWGTRPIDEDRTRSGAPASESSCFANSTNRHIPAPCADSWDAVYALVTARMAALEAKPPLPLE